MEIQGLGNSSGFGEVLQVVIEKKGEHFRNSPAAFYFYIFWDILMSKHPECLNHTYGEKFLFFSPLKEGNCPK